MKRKTLNSKHQCRVVYRRTGPRFAQAVIAHLYDVTVEELHSATRCGPRAAFARQIAMYLMHVVYGLTIGEVAERFGRERSTASHACRRIEDMRDDPALDRLLAKLENLLREVSVTEVAL
jgi:chromosomal replication initiation ATPase DnaA